MNPVKIQAGNQFSTVDRWQSSQDTLYNLGTACKYRVTCSLFSSCIHATTYWYGDLCFLSSTYYNEQAVMIPEQNPIVLYEPAFVSFLADLFHVRTMGLAQQ